ncbi:MAG: hypothetical protein RR413_04995 [Christensenellaceae bacterium]
MKNVLVKLENFCGYTYYGGKHHESILTRFLQCYYLPTYFNMDKRRSHYSSMIMSGQMTREEAIIALKKTAYISSEMLNSDINYLTNYLEMSEAEFRNVLAQPKHKNSDYPTSALNIIAPIARKFRRLLG